MAKLTKTITVLGVISQEVTQPIITSTQEEEILAEKLLVTEVTAAKNNDAVIKAYLEREQLHDIPISHFVDWAAVPAYTSVPREIPLDLDIPVGQSLTVGHLSGAVASNVTYTLVYSIK